MSSETLEDISWRGREILFLRLLLLSLMTDELFCQILAKNDTDTAAARTDPLRSLQALSFHTSKFSSLDTFLWFTY